MPGLPPLIPPFRFAAVEDNVFRGGFPKLRNVQFIKRLHLKTLLSLSPDPLPEEIQQFCNEQDINMIHLKVDKMKEDNIPLTYSRTIAAIQTIIDPTNLPIYIHCLDGSDVIGLVVACLRKLEMWNTTSAMGEYLRYLRSNVISPEVFEFVEKFHNLDVTIPTSLPHWLWGGSVSFRKHPCLKLKFLNPEMMTEEEREIRDLKEMKEKYKEEYYRKRKNDLLDNLLDPSVPASHATNRNRQQSQPFGPSAQAATVPSSSSGTDQNELSDSGVDGQANESDANDQNGEDELLVDVDVDAMMIGDLDELDYYDQRAMTDEKLDADDIPADGTRVSGEGRYRAEPLSLLLRALALEGLEW
ncbi:unnamed protein product [Umbelopsis ramanniana]